MRYFGRIVARVSAHEPIRSSKYLSRIDRIIMPHAMDLLIGQFQASHQVTISLVRDGEWSAVSQHSSTCRKIGGDRHYTRRNVVKFTPNGCPYLHCSCYYYVQHGIVCRHVIRLKCGEIINSTFIRDFGCDCLHQHQQFEWHGTRSVTPWRRMFPESVRIYITPQSITHW